MTNNVLGSIVIKLKAEIAEFLSDMGKPSASLGCTG
jgi:hypothetical protein